MTLTLAESGYDEDSGRECREYISINRQKVRNIRYIDKHMGLYGGFVYRVVVILDNTHSAF